MHSPAASYTILDYPFRNNVCPYLKVLDVCLVVKDKDVVLAGGVRAHEVVTVPGRHDLASRKEHCVNIFNGGIFN